MQPPNMDPASVPNDNEGPWALATVWVIRALALTAVVLRLFTRTIAKHTAGWDDAAIAMASLLSLAGGIGDTYRVSLGWGKHSAHVFPRSNLQIIEKWQVVGELINFNSLFFMRLSICIFTLRLLPVTKKWSIRFIYFALFLNFAVTLANCVIFCTRCIPIEAIWNHTIHGKCFSNHTLAAAFGATSILGVIVDFVIVAVPISVIRTLQMNKKTKIAISAIMSLGLLAAGCSIGKMIADMHIGPDIYDTIPVFLCSIFEEEVGIICASMPAMRQFYKAIKARRDGTSQPQSKPNGNPYYGHSERSDPMRSPLVSQDAKKPTSASKGFRTSTTRKSQDDVEIELRSIRDLEKN